jgi:hypothetical protein
MGVPASKPWDVTVPVVDVLEATCETMQLPIDVNDPPVTNDAPVTDEKEAVAS